MGTTCRTGILSRKDYVMSDTKIESSKTPIIEGCPCGRTSSIETGTDLASDRKWYHVRCDDLDCWHGPHKYDRRFAIAAWNQLIRLGKAAEANREKTWPEIIGDFCSEAGKIEHYIALGKTVEAFCKNPPLLNEPELNEDWLKRQRSIAHNDGVHACLDMFKVDTGSGE